MTRPTTNVLLVEDDEEVRQGLQLLLSRKFQVHSVQDGPSAMVATRRSRPDAIVLDLGLPGGDGLQLLEWMREVPELERVPKLVVTGRDLAAARRPALQNGACAVFAKPVDANALIVAIEAGIDLLRTARPGVSVLLIEDDEATSRALTMLLRHRGYAVRCAADGATGLMMVQKAPPQAVVLDLGLPGGGGLALLQRLRANPALQGIPVIVMSGVDVAQRSAELYAAGADALLQKPTTVDMLIEALEEVC